MDDTKKPAKVNDTHVEPPKPPAPEPVRMMAVEILRGYWPKTWTGPPEIDRKKWEVGAHCEITEEEFDWRGDVKPPIFAPSTAKKIAAYRAMKGWK